MATDGTIIDGLKVTIGGGEITRLLERRIKVHERRAARWKHERKRTKKDETVNRPLLPDHMCENEQEEEEWRIEVLAFIRDHIDQGAIYQLNEADLAFGELLPEKPGWMQQVEYEERTAIGFHLARLVKEIRHLDVHCTHEGLPGLAPTFEPEPDGIAELGGSNGQVRAPRRRQRPTDHRTG